MGDVGLAPGNHGEGCFDGGIVLHVHGEIAYVGWLRVAPASTILGCGVGCVCWRA